MTEEDIHSLVAEGARLGVIDRVEHDMIEGVLDLADSALRTIMTPRPAVVWVDLDDPRDAVVQKIAACPHARYWYAVVRSTSPSGWCASRICSTNASRAVRSTLSRRSMRR